MTRPRLPPRLTGGLLTCLIWVGACQRLAPQAPHVDVSWTIDPIPARVGRMTLAVSLRGDGDAAVRGAAMRIEGHMSHPGMAPVLANAVEHEPGVYRAPLELTMAGDWVLLVDATLSDGRRVHRRIDLASVRPAP